MSDDLRSRLDTKSTEELVDILREADPDQWRPEVFPLVDEILLGRGVDTAPIKAAGPQPFDVLEFDSLEIVGSRRSTAEASLCQMALAQAGIKAWLPTEVLAGVAPHLAVGLGIDILVRLADADAARDILERIEAGEAAIPLEAQTCPECNSAETERVRVSSRASAVANWALVGLPIPAAEWRWRCTLCGREWDERES